MADLFSLRRDKAFPIVPLCSFVNVMRLTPARCVGEHDTLKPATIPTQSDTKLPEQTRKIRQTKLLSN